MEGGAETGQGSCKRQWSDLRSDAQGERHGTALDRGNEEFYTCDSAKRLASVLPPPGTYTFTYDDNGNRTGRLWTGSVYYSYDDENQLLSAATATVSTPVASRWKTEWVYDARGRMRIWTAFSFNAITGWVLSSETRYLYHGRRVIQRKV